ELKLGGRYRIEGNASGSITRCEPPGALDLTWEFMGHTSWVQVRVDRDGRKARLTLEHIAHKETVGAAAEHFKTFGPGAVGVGWDLSLYGLERQRSSRSSPPSSASPSPRSRNSSRCCATAASRRCAPRARAACTR